MLKRTEISKEYKWNFDDYYKNWNEWDNDFEKIKKIASELPTYKDKLKSCEIFSEFLKKYENISRLIEKNYIYTFMLKDLNSKDEEASKKMQVLQMFMVNFSTQMSWYDSQLIEIPLDTMKKWCEEDKFIGSYTFPIMEQYRGKKHILDEKSSKLLSYYGQYFGASQDIYTELSISDIKWNTIVLENGEKIEITNGSYSKLISTNKNQEDRKKAFMALYESYNSNINTYGAIYRSIIQKKWGYAQSHYFKSCLEVGLEPKNIPLSVFTSLIEASKKCSEPLRRYMRLRKKILNLKDYYYFDNSIKLVDYTREFEYNQARNLVKNSVKLLGKEYCKNMEQALSDGWLDVFETENKRSGAYSIGIFDVHPYMLLNYQGTLNSVFTLAHELGHTLHSLYSSANQPYATHDYTIFVAEVASTFNERLLLDYMLKNSDNKLEKIALIEESLDGMVGTFFIQALFANYEYIAHQKIENNEPITTEILSEIMATLFNEYFEDTIKRTPLSNIIWARIPHFFNSPFYVYQYATSFAASSNLYDRIANEKYSLEERENAKKKYLELLSSGGNDNPISQLKKAGVDLTNPESFMAIEKQMNELLDKLENLLDDTVI